MKQVEVTFSAYRVFEPGKATIGSSLTSGLKTFIAAPSMGQARAMIEAHLVNFRDADGRVRFVEINPVTARLLGLPASAPPTGIEACLQISAELLHPDPDRLLPFGPGILEVFDAQDLIFGTHG